MTSEQGVQFDKLKRLLANDQTFADGFVAMGDFLATRGELHMAFLSFTRALDTGHANEQAARFAAAIEIHPGTQLEFPVASNEVFVRWTSDDYIRLAASGIEFHLWPGHDDLARFVFGHSTTSEQTNTLINAFKNQES